MTGGAVNTTEVVRLIHKFIFSNPVQVFPTMNDCSHPPLPTPRAHMATFLTAGPSPSIAVCGGISDPDNPHQSDCLVLDPKMQSWKAGVLGPMLTIQNQGLAAVTMPVGVYLIAGGKYSPNETEVLLTGTTHWQKGPTPPPMDTAPCAWSSTEKSLSSTPRLQDQSAK